MQKIQYQHTAGRFKRRLVRSLSIITGIVLLLNGCLMMRTSDSKAIANFQKMGLALTTPTYVVNNNNLHYAIIGADTLPTIVFVHGSPGSWNAFEDFLKDTVLLRKFRMVSVDRPGFGYSNFGEAKNLQQQSTIIGSLLGNLQNNKPLYLVGHSLGGPLVAELAADYPKRVNGIIILAGALNPALEKKETWRSVMMVKPLCYLLPGALRPSNTELWYLKKDLYILQHKLNTITCPVYIMHGQKDMLVDVENVTFMKEYFTNAALVSDTILKDENHFIPWTQHNAIRNWIMRLPLK
jgi:pimeloyl-ACP methyl ester carboxylesterase